MLLPQGSRGLGAQCAAFPAGLPGDCRGRWESFVEETLSEANRRNAVDLVSRPGLRAEHCRPRGPAWPGLTGLPVRRAGGGEAPAYVRPPWPLQVSTHHLHPSSEDEDMEGVFPNELSLQQVRVARPPCPHSAVPCVSPEPRVGPGEVPPTTQRLCSLSTSRRGPGHSASRPLGTWLAVWMWLPWRPPEGAGAGRGC